MKQIQFRLTAYTDPAGKWNEEAPNKGNEDNLFVDVNLSNGTQGEFVSDQTQILSEHGCLMVVADGMGGMNAGEIASAIAIETVKQEFAPEKLTKEIVATEKSRARYMEHAVIEADAAIKAEARRNKAYEGMGSTIVMVWLCRGVATVTWCGDSRAYLFRESEGLRQISKDHSYVQSLVDDGKITVEEAFDHPYGNIITRSLGDPEKKAQADSVSIQVFKGDILLICSDGLSGVLRDRKNCDAAGNLYPVDTLEDIIRENRSSMQACRKALWQAAEKAEWYDNVTAILCEILEGEVMPNSVNLLPASAEIKSKSFIQIRLYKKNLRLAVAILCAAIVIGSIVFLFRPIFHRPDPAMEAFRIRRDSLINVTDSLGLNGLNVRIKQMSDTLDMSDLTEIQKAVNYCVELRSNIGTLSKQCDSIYVEKLVQALDSLNVIINESTDVENLKQAAKSYKDIKSRYEDRLKENNSIISNGNEGDKAESPHEEVNGLDGSTVTGPGITPVPSDTTSANLDATKGKDRLNPMNL